MTHGCWVAAEAGAEEVAAAKVAVAQSGAGLGGRDRAEVEAAIQAWARTAVAKPLTVAAAI